MSERTDIVTDIPYKHAVVTVGRPGAHSGGRIRVGPDGFLYITTGDNHHPTLPQDVTRLGGKVLRVDRDGKAAPGNNAPAGGDPRIFTYRHRNVQGIAFRPGTGRREHAPTHYVQELPQRLASVIEEPDLGQDFKLDALLLDGKRPFHEQSLVLEVLEERNAAPGEFGLQAGVQFLTDEGRGAFKGFHRRGREARDVQGVGRRPARARKDERRHARLHRRDRAGMTIAGEALGAQPRTRRSIGRALWQGRPPGLLLLVFGVAIAVFMATFLYVFLRLSQMRPGLSNQEFGQGVEQWFFLLMALHFAMILVAWVLVAFYLVFLFKTDRVAADKKALWAVVLFMAGLVAMPIFFWLYIWPERDAVRRGSATLTG